MEAEQLIKPSEKRLAESLEKLGEKLKSWEGKDINEFGEEIKETIESGKSVYSETKDAVYLLVFFVLQTMLALIISRGMFSEVMFKKTFEYPKESMVGLGGMLMTLGKAIREGREKTLDTLLATLLYAHEHDLLLSP